jgi:aspartyl-tRNA(Asn)/glutamyl-tRNA(Gln) amidotransferase subunit A
VLNELLGRIDRLNPTLRAYISVNTDDAIKAARRAEALWMSDGEKPLLCGVPVSVKDTIEVGGMPTTYNSVPFKDNYRDDSEIALRLRRAGAVILGKTTTTEFARGDFPLTGHPRNPWDLEHTTGGSSAGAGASVAAGLGAMALGTDSGGSVRRPAAYNGVFGMIATYQRIPAVQAWRASPGRSTNGPLTRTVRDSALLFQATAGYDPRDPESDLPDVDDYLRFDTGTIRRKRIAVTYDYGVKDGATQVDPEVTERVREAAEVFRWLGCQVIETDPPVLDDVSEMLAPGVWAYAGDHYNAAEALIPGFWEKHADDLGPRERSMMQGWDKVMAWQYRRVLRRNRAYAQQMKEWFRDYDYILSPCVAGPAPRIGDKGPTDRVFTFIFNHSHNPAASVPFGFHSSGLPLAVQIVGRSEDDLGVLRMSAALEAERPWSTHWPAIAEASTVPQLAVAEGVR